MFPLSEFPDRMNKILIHNGGVWNASEFFSITFTDPSLMRKLLQFSLQTSGAKNANKCYPMEHGHYYVVKTADNTYRGDALSIGSFGIGILPCLRNNNGINNNIVSIASHNDAYFNRDYGRPSTFPLSSSARPLTRSYLFGDVSAASGQRATQQIAGSTSAFRTNRLRVYLGHSGAYRVCC